MSDQIIEDGVPRLSPTVREVRQRSRLVDEAEGGAEHDADEERRCAGAGPDHDPREWRATNPDSANRAAAKLGRLTTKFRTDSRFTRFADVNLASSGSLDAVDFVPRNLSAAALD